MSQRITTKQLDAHIDTLNNMTKGQRDGTWEFDRCSANGGHLLVKKFFKHGAESHVTYERESPRIVLNTVNAIINTIQSLGV